MKKNKVKVTFDTAPLKKVTFEIDDLDMEQALKEYGFVDKDALEEAEKQNSKKPKKLDKEPIANIV